MASKFCLIPQKADKLKQMVVSGEISPDKLNSMNSKQRLEFFTKQFGEADGKNMSLMVERKLISKNYETGLMNWVEQAGGIKPELKQDLHSRIERMVQKDAEILKKMEAGEPTGKLLLNPENEEAFLAELAEAKLGVSVTAEEAQKITDISKEMAKAKEVMEKGGDRFKFGASKVAMENYMSDLQRKGDIGIKEFFTRKGAAKDFFKGAYKEHGVGGSVKEVVQYTGGLAKSFLATLDNSAVFRQGWKTMFTNPKIWIKNAPKTFADIYKSVKGVEALDLVKTDLYSRENAVNGLYRKMKLDIGVTEEAFPVSLPEKIPILKRFYKASENAYSGFLYRMRADIADKYVDMAVRNGVNVNDQQQAEAMGNIINSLTGRGNLGNLEKAGKFTNATFFSLKNFKSNIDTLTAHSLQKSTPFAKKEAAKNLMKIVAGTAAVMYSADKIGKMFGIDDAIEWDPRSSNFGRIKVKDTRFDISGGMASINTLAARLASLSSKSSLTGEINELNTGKFGARTALDIVEDFFENKLSPTAGMVRNLLKGTDFGGAPTNLPKELKGLFVPLPISNAIETYKNPDSANTLAVMIADGLGIGTNTWGTERVANLDSNTSDKMDRLREQVGEEGYAKIKADYEAKVAPLADKIVNSEEYKNASAGDRKAMLKGINEEALEEVYYQNDIFNSNEDPVKAKAKYEASKKLDEYNELIASGKADQASKLIEGLNEAQLKSFKSQKRNDIKGGKEAMTGKHVEDKLNSLPPNARTAELKNMVDNALITKEAADELIKTNKDFKSVLEKADYSELSNNYKQAKAQVEFEKISSLPEAVQKAKIKETRKTNQGLGDKLQDMRVAKKYDLTEDEAKMIGSSYKDRAKNIKEAIKGKSESEKNAYIAKLTKAGIIPDGITKTGRRSKSETKRREELLNMLKQ